MWFKIDENLPLEVAGILHDAGHDAHSVHDQQLSGAADQVLAQTCQQERRALLTLDMDFADIRAYPPQDYEGILVLRLSRQDRRAVAQTIMRLLPLLSTEPLSGKLWIVDDRRIRIRE